MKKLFYFLGFLIVIGEISCNSSANKTLESTGNDSVNKAKAVSSSYIVKSANANVEIKVDTNKWTVEKADSGDQAEYNFVSKGSEDVAASLIAEDFGTSIDSLKEIVLDNAKIAAPDIKIINEAMRDVSGVKVLFMQLEGTVEGTKICYFGYYYSSPKGTIQFVTYTSPDLLKEYRSDMEELLNQMIILK